jgi:DNA-binding beta-propeller fold protein YncE
MLTDTPRQVRHVAACAGLSLLLAATSVNAAPPGLAIALNSVDGTISLIDTETYKVIGKAPVCKEPHHLMPTPDDKSLIVACSASNQLVFFDPLTGKEQRRIRDISDPYQLGYSPDRKLFVATSLRLDRVDIYDPADFKLKARLHAPRTPSHMAFDAAGDYVFITLQDSNEKMANLATRAGVEGNRLSIHAPLMALSKAEIIRLGSSLGVDYSLTVSCYQADAKGHACGVCDSCRLRAEGFAGAGVSDPTHYLA